MAAVTPRPSLPPGPFLIVGLARSGLAVAHALAARGHVVIGTDTRPPADDARAASACATARPERARPTTRNGPGGRGGRGVTAAIVAAAADPSRGWRLRRR